MIVVLTTPRRPQFLGATLRGLDNAGAAALPRIVCVDGAVSDILKLRVVPADWEVVSVGIGKQGTQLPFAGVCSLAAKRGGDLLFFEDDIRPCVNAVTALNQIAVPEDCGYLVAFDHRNLLIGPEPRLVRVAADDPVAQGTWGFWGNQALKLPRLVIEHLAQQPANRSYDPSGLGPRSLLYGSDVWLGALAASAEAPWKFYGLLAPSLFQHIGGISAVSAHWKLEGRTAQNWRPEYDALDLVEHLRCATPSNAGPNPSTPL